MRPKFTKRGLQFALHNPVLSLRLLIGSSIYEEVLQVQVGKDLELLRKRMSKSPEPREFFQSSWKATDDWIGSLAPAENESSWRMLGRWHSFLYAVVRSASPIIVVETGVLYGHSSAAILAALEGNRLGTLISIDLPTEQHRSVIIGRQHVQVGLSNELSVGCAVPPDLRKRWSLRLGNSLELLPKILEETGPISIFIHDSLHTYDHMMGEFRLGYDALEPGGLMIADDIGYNAAWQDFCRSKNQDWRVISKGPNTLDQIGFLTKSSK